MNVWSRVVRSRDFSAHFLRIVNRVYFDRTSIDYYMYLINGHISANGYFELYYRNIDEWRAVCES